VCTRPQTYTPTRHKLASQQATSIVSC
jgi:hypothetical protein